MNNKIYTKNNQKIVCVTPKLRSLIKRIINRALDYEGVEVGCEVSVTFTDNNSIQVLNRDFRGKDMPTDVLSFPLLENGEYDPETLDASGLLALGDIVLSVEKALSQSREFGHSIERELGFLTVHSVLHLLGYDHEVSKDDEIYMNDTCEVVLADFGLQRDGYSVSDEILESEPLSQLCCENKGDVKKKTAFITIIGRPNVGKSTLMNTIIGEKVAIVSNKPQTTRNKITGIYTEDDAQYVFIDTPGMHKPKTKLGEFMMKSADESLSGTDVIIYMIESGQTPEKADIHIIEKIRKSKIPALLVINKIDAGKRDKLLITIDKFSQLHNFVSVIPISALFNDGVSIVMDELKPFLKEERWYFPDDILTDMPEREICSEIIREKLLRNLDDEIPHGAAVVIEDFKESERLIEIRAEICCEKVAHKKIIIGKNGDTLKRIATYAREDMEAFFNQKVYLNLWVKVKENWRDSELHLNRLGFRKD